MTYRRYAIYATPDGKFAQLGAAWLGWDMHAGRAVAHPPDLDLSGATERPRRYGLHATLKPPMRLAPGSDAEGLSRAARALAADLPPITIDRLDVMTMGRFLALRPVDETAALHEMAETFVRGLDTFRAAPSEDEVARRQNPRLSARQRANLAQWGYPHVVQDFRFHITLTGPLRDAEPLRAQAQRHFAPVLSQPYTIDHVTLAAQDAQGFFHALERIPLGNL
ncbi:DUF1045 domain-containing protein [Sulfitobacter albidus]|uniref:DUF1045 domain-containing protein n=1 Tax=Sulfitobacter albidus TaxID=2829501 RepID=UPI0020C8374C|nr:DUF1045 domain-containing protein [Sulfitobacter albidus]